MRIDKWLWTARFYKTRSKAKEAVVGGKVHVNSERTKPSRELQLGDELEITRGLDKEVVIVTDFSPRRGNAELAKTLYEETEESLNQRLEAAAMRRMARAGLTTPKLKPTKTARRTLRDMKQKAE